ncbi:ribonuclease H-like domain-containing protein [Tanacetum coccineum]|uniref:Ribonuclease H-like domain-containing protein n=1 Tax=Tanacetum coccineum TaxID=301880 RepID=A0ABQ5CZ11_9ASTR
MTPRAVLIKSGLKSFNVARTVNTIRSVNNTRPFSTARPRAVNTARPFVNTARANRFNAIKPSACWVWRPIKPNGASLIFNKYNYIDDNLKLNDKGFVDHGCSRHMTRNLAYLSNFKEFDRGNVTFRGGAYGGRITGKGTLKTDNLVFDDVYFVKELKFNLFSILQMCDKKNYVLFTDTECLVLSPNFKLSDENHILLKIPRQDNMYRFDMKNIVHKESLTCLVAKATSDESMLWHRRLGHINFKNINKLVKENLVRDLPLKRFENNQTCVACLKGKQHRNIFLGQEATKDEKSEILKNFIKEIENLVDNKVKIIRSDNETEFKNKVMDDFCREKSIRRKYSVARTPQQNGIAERKNRTLIEAARTMLADFKLPTTFWIEAVSTACYVQNRVLIVKPHNKTPYELFRGFKPAIGFMKPFGCHVTILNTLDNLGKFDGKSDEGFFVGYSLSSKAFRVYNTRTKKVQENLHIRSAAENLIKDKDESHDENDDTEKSNDDSNFKDDGFEDPDHPNKVYKVVKALYGLHQAPRAWYETLANYLLRNGFQRGKIDQTLFIKRQKGDILLVQIYVDDIIFGSTKKELCDEFEKLMKDKFQMNVKSASTPVDLEKPLVQDGDATDIDEHLYRSMIRSLMYLTASRKDRKSTTRDLLTKGFDAGRFQYLVLTSLRRHLKLEDHDGINSIPNLEIFTQLALIGYHTDSDKLTFQKGAFSPQWRFLIHNILHCLSPKKTSWEQFSSNNATADICLATNRKLYLNEIVARHSVPILIISDRDSRFTSRFWHSMQEALGTWLNMSMAYHPQTDGHSEHMIQALEDILRACVLDFRGSWDVHLVLVDFSYNNSYHSSMRCAPFEALYGRKFRSLIMWAKIGEGHLIGPGLIRETTGKISQIKDKLKAARDR